jgi:hypothetical protein
MTPVAAATPDRIAWGHATTAAILLVVAALGGR